MAPPIGHGALIGLSGVGVESPDLNDDDCVIDHDAHATRVYTASAKKHERVHQKWWRPRARKLLDSGLDVDVLVDVVMDYVADLARTTPLPHKRHHRVNRATLCQLRRDLRTSPKEIICVSTPPTKIHKLMRM